MCRAFEEVKKEGIEQGIELGIEQGKIDTAKKMLAKNKYSLDEISELSDLPLEIIKELAKKISD